MGRAADTPGHGTRDQAITDALESYKKPVKTGTVHVISALHIAYKE